MAKIIDQFTPRHAKYVEVFTGAAHVFFAKTPVSHEVLNDLFKGLVDFYRVLQNPKLRDEFLRLVHHKLYSRNEFEYCRKNWKKTRGLVKRTADWFVVARQCRSGLFESSWSSEPNRTSRGMPSDISKWMSALDGLPEVHDRLRWAQIENLDFRALIKKHDNASTWFYADPPYVPDTRKGGKYEHEMTYSDHLDLVNILLDLKGMCLLSGYRTDLYAPLETAGWWCEPKETYCGSSGDKRMEYLWLSPNLQKDLTDCGKNWTVCS